MGDISCDISCDFPDFWELEGHLRDAFHERFTTYSSFFCEAPDFRRLDEPHRGKVIFMYFTDVCHHCAPMGVSEKGDTKKN